MKKESKKAYLTPSANFSLPCVKDVLLWSNDLFCPDTSWSSPDDIKIGGDKLE